MKKHNSVFDADEAQSTDSTVRELRLTAGAVEALRDHLFQDTEQERFAYGTAVPTADALLVPEPAVHPVPDESLRSATATAANMTMDAEQDWLEHCLETGTTPILIHSHPPGAGAAFSGDHYTTDVQAARAYDRFTAQIMPDHGFVFGVLTPDTFHATYAPPLTDLDDHGPMEPRPAAPLDIAVRGAWRVDPPLSTWVSDKQNQPVTAATPNDGGPRQAQADADTASGSNRITDERFDRQLRVLTAADQYALQDAHVTVVGAGGIGSWLTTFLARMGVGHLTLTDPDVVEESNLSRLYGASSADVGQPKVEVIADMVNTMVTADPGDDEGHDDQDAVVTGPVNPVAERIEDRPDLVRAADVVVSTVDNHATVLWLHDAAVAHLQPLVDAGSLITLDGDVNPADPAPGNTVASMRATCQVTVPGVTACRTCLDRVDYEQARLDWLSPEERAAEVERGYVDDTVLTPDPAVLFLNGVAVSLAVQQVVNLLTGFDDLTGIAEFDALSLDMRANSTLPAPDCPVCSPEADLLGSGTVTTAAMDDTSETGTDPEDAA